MELFYSRDIDGQIVRLPQEEAQHCIKVLRHRVGDEINVIDGEGTLLTCRLVDDSPKHAEAEIISAQKNWGSHEYNLKMAVCPTKNMDRYEWFVEKGCEVGMDSVVPVFGDHSERKVFKPERVEKILVSAAKQSLKAAVPSIDEVTTVKQFINRYSKEDSVLKLIAYCFEEEEAPRISVKKALDSYDGKDIVILIGPEGDFSKEEALLAIEKGFIPVHLGQSRLRTETAAVTAVEAVYFRYME